jgi:thioredoxin reductase
MNSEVVISHTDSRRAFIKKSGIALTALIIPFDLTQFLKHDTMKVNKQYDVIIIGGSYSGLAAGMALGRALRKVLIIDSGKPCNSQTPHSHNFLTQDGKTPMEIGTLAKDQVLMYDSVAFLSGLATKGKKIKNGYEIQIATGETFTTSKLIFATGIKDISPNIPGFSECWGISVIHCPYCHGYEVKSQKTGILGNGEYGFEFSSLISNWTNDLTLYTNGKSTLSLEQRTKLNQHKIDVIEDEIDKLEHKNGYLQHIIFKNGKMAPVKALYTRTAFEQHCSIPELLGSELNIDGYIKVDSYLKTNVQGVYACGDNTTRMRTVASAVAMGTTAGMMVNKELIEEQF